MEIVPAIDLMSGKVVRLIKGLPQEKTEYSSNPTQTAFDLINAGAKRLHIIDLDATLGKGDNISTLEKIRKEVDVPIQVGGGIRTSSTARKLFDIGFDQIILGSMLFSEEDQVHQLTEAYGFERIIGAVDYKDNLVMIDGWQSTVSVTPLNAAKELSERGFKWLLMTDTSRDGTLQGPDTTLYRCLLRRYNKIRLIAAGGIGNIEHINILRKLNITRCVVGKAIYDGKIELAELFKERT
jgi:phosphoribosylformimino-5-aminoimidazole carboxamide ribotide isomerase